MLTDLREEEVPDRRPKWGRRTVKTISLGR